MMDHLNVSLRAALVVGGLAFAVAGCGYTTPQSTVSRNLDSGVTSNNGGGMAPANFGSSAPIRAP